MTMQGDKMSPCNKPNIDENLATTHRRNIISTNSNWNGSQFFFNARNKKKRSKQMIRQPTSQLEHEHKQMNLSSEMQLKTDCDLSI